MIALKHTMLLIFFLLISATAKAQHWQSSDGPVPLLIDSNLVRIKLQGELTDQALQALVNDQEKLVRVVKEIESYEGFVVCSLSTVVAYDQTKMSELSDDVQSPESPPCLYLAWIH